MKKNPSHYHPGIIKLFQESKGKIEHALGGKTAAVDFTSTPMDAIGDPGAVYIPEGVDIENAPSEKFGAYTIKKADRCFAAYDGPKLVGVLFPGRFAVAPEYQNKGIGKALMKAYRQAYPDYKPEATTETTRHIYDKAAVLALKPGSNERLATFMGDFLAGTASNPLGGRGRVWENKVPIEVRPFDRRIHISDILSLERGKGHASEALKWLCSLADKHSVGMSLNVDSYGTRPGLNNQQLDAWYRRAGFKPLRGMLYVREPEGPRPVKGQSAKEAAGAKQMPSKITAILGCKSAAYLAYELDGKSRASLLEKFPPKFPDVVAHHVTVKHGVKHSDPLPEAEPVKVVGYASDESLECAVVEVGGTTERPDGSTYHITLSLDRSKGRMPVESNELLAQGWQEVEPLPVEAAPARLS
jgi:GNAT superfamily N-acetyltransferase